MENEKLEGKKIEEKVVEKVEEKRVEDNLERVKEDVSFERDVKMFMVDFELLQKKYNLVIRPVITPYGPDFNLARKAK